MNILPPKNVAAHKTYTAIIFGGNKGIMWKRSHSRHTLHAESKLLD